MYDEDSEPRRTTLVAGLILLIVLAAVAAISGEPLTPAPDEIANISLATNAASGPLLARALQVDWSHRAASRRLTAIDHTEPMHRLTGSLRPIVNPLSQCFGEDALIAYDLGVAPAEAVQAAAEVLGRTLVALLGGLEPAHGTTSLCPDGGLVFHIELHPAAR